VVVERDAMKLSAALITRGEPTLPAAIASIRPHVDEIVIVGTTPEAEAIARPLADTYETYLDANGPDGLEDFAKARQRSFDLATGTHCLWVDADDTITGGDKLRELAASMPDGTAYVELPYIYESNKRGVPTLIQMRERLVKPIAAWRWTDPLHEGLVTEATPRTRGECDGITIVHQRKGPTDFKRNIRILKKWLEKDPRSTRAQFYLGMAYFDAARFDEAWDAFDTFLRDFDGAPDELAMVFMRRSWLAARKHDAAQAIASAEGALRAMPWAECSFALARAYQVKAAQTDAREDYERVVFYIRAGLAAPLTQTRLWVNPLDRACYAHATLNHALHALGDTRGALDSVRKALEYLPDDDGLRSNELRYEAELAHQAAEAAKADVQRVAAKADAMLQESKIRLDVRDTVGELLHVQMPKPKGCLDIVFACGDAWEEWTPATIERHGIGGSEQAVANMAKQLAARGHRVRVYTSVGNGAGHYDGAVWLPSGELHKAGSPDVLVAWREMRFLNLTHAKVRVAWAHDTILQGMNEWNAVLADRVLALSEWHRMCLLRQHPELRAEQMVVTRNGIDPSLFANCENPERNPHVAIFSSSPTRGLPLLLNWWPRVRKVVPDAELRVAYGFDTWEKIAASNGDKRSLALIDDMKRRIEETEGVTMLGRIPPARLAEEMSRAGVWLHPSWDTVNDCEWFETSCIGAMEAAAAGCRIVATDVGALSETVGPRGLLVDERPNEENVARWWINSIASAMGATPRTGGLMFPVYCDAWNDRAALAADARKRFDWSGVADQWERMFKGLLEEVGKEAA
jgi:glycosyltransferase involved in cell wall biosynthesis/tetratricopeptide (TPR) repeat protein